jgi:hypothetical protein
LADRNKLNQKRRYLAQHLGGNEPREPRLDMIDSLIDEQIRAAQAEGAFDNLPGQGKPLPKDPSEGIAGDKWMSNRVLKQAGFVPDWIQLRKEIAEERHAVNAAMNAYRERARVSTLGDAVTSAELKSLEDRYVQLATAINRKIDEHNTRCPPSQTLTRFVEDALTRWG